MRAFKHANKTNNELLARTFPMLFEEDWQDSESLNYSAISIWDHWLQTTGDYHLLINVPPAEQKERHDKFRLLHSLIIENLSVFNATYRKKWRFKQTRSKNDLYWRLDPCYHKDSFMLLLPEIKAIYSYEGDDTSVMWYQDESVLREFDGWVEQSGLKYIQSKT
jgi:hypothetical protein